MEKNILLNTEASRHLSDIFESLAETDSALMETGGELTPELEAAMARDEVDLRRKVDGYAAVARNFDAQINTIDGEIKRLQALKKSRTAARERLLSYLEFQMNRFGVTELQGDTCRVSFRKSTALEVDEAAVIKPYLQLIAKAQETLPAYLQIGVKVGKKELADAIDAGQPIPEGAAGKVERRNLQLK